MTRSVVVTGLVLFLVVYGAAFGLFGEAIPVVFLAPVVILAILVIWALPDTKAGATRTLEFLFFAFLIAAVVWPNYLALALPGLPWITMARITGVPFAIVLLICLSSSSQFRLDLRSSLSGAPSVWILVLVFVVIQFTSVGLSSNPLQSFDRFLSDQLSWTAMFFGSCYLMAKPGRATRWVRIIWGTAIFVGVIALWERKLTHVPWADHIPSFLAVDDPRVENILAGRVRLYGGGYRAESTFDGPIQLGEFVALVMPFILHLAMTSRQAVTRWAAIATVPFLTLVVLAANARSGMFGWLIAFLLYGAYWGYRRFRAGSVLGTFVFFGYPAAGALALGSVMFVGRLRALFFGTGLALASTDARKEQWALGIPKIIKHPWGYGVGRAAEVVGWTSQGGDLSIDTYYLSVVIDYGVQGFVAYFGMILMAILGVVRLVLTREPGEDEEAWLAVPAAIAMAAFVVIKSVFSEEDNHSLAFMILGMIVALCSRLKALPKETSAPLGVPAAAALRARPALARG